MRGLLLLGLALVMAITEASHPNVTERQLLKWKSTGILLSPKNDSHNVVAVKDPTVVFYKGSYHLFMSSVINNSYSMIYTNFSDWNKAKDAKYYYFKDNAVGGGYTAAPEVFYFAPQKLWYLIYQDGNAGYSTNKDISDFNGWSATKHFYKEQPKIIADNIGKGYWVDFWVICDKKNCHLFSSDDNGHLYRSQTSIKDFPNGMSEPVIALHEANPKDLYEASNMYKIGDKYLLLVECANENWKRYFRSWTAPAPEGPYTPLASSFEHPFMGTSNVEFKGTPWTADISHGDVVRYNIDQNMELKHCNLEYVYQGMDPKTPSDTPYNDLPWRLALLKQSNSICKVMHDAKTEGPTTAPTPTAAQ